MHPTPTPTITAMRVVPVAGHDGLIPSTVVRWLLSASG